MYKTTPYDTVVRLSDNLTIPFDERNADYLGYLAWVAEGNSAERQGDILSTSPSVISRFQAKAVLLRHGLLDEVEAYATATNTNPLVKLAWNEAVEVKRNSLMVMNIAIILDLSQSQLDNLFAEAATIEV